MTIFNHTDIEQRFEAILEANTALYDGANTDGTKLITIEEGVPLGPGGMTQLVPGAFITVESERAITRGTSQSSSTHGIESDVRYRVVLAVGDADHKTAENRLNTFQKLIIDTIMDNDTLNSGGSDPKADMIKFESMRRERETVNPLFIRHLIFRAIIRSGN